MQVRELIELLSKEPQTATVVGMGPEGDTYTIDGVLDFDTGRDEVILEIDYLENR